jgi:hypothetical protein
MIGVIASAIVVTSSERRSRAKMRQPGNREWGTVIQSVGATSFCVPNYYVLHQSPTAGHFQKVVCDQELSI